MCDRWRRYEDLIRNGEEDQLMKMIRRREDMNAADGTQGKTLVHLASEHGQLSLLERLAARDANFHVRTKATKDTPAHLAVRNGHAKILRFLGERGETLGSQRPDGDAPIHFACMYGHEECVKILCSFSDMPPIVEEEAGAAMDGEEGGEGGAEAHPIIETEPIDPDGIVPVNLNVTNNNGSTPAHLAALKGHTKILIMLKENHANLNIANKGDNLTPLDWAIKNQQNETIAYLKSFGYAQTPPPPPAPAPAPAEPKKKKGGKKKKKK